MFVLFCDSRWLKSPKINKTIHYLTEIQYHCVNIEFNLRNYSIHCYVNIRIKVKIVLIIVINYKKYIFSAKTFFYYYLKFLLLFSILFYLNLRYRYSLNHLYKYNEYYTYIRIFNQRIERVDRHDSSSHPSLISDTSILIYKINMIINNFKAS